MRLGLSLFVDESARAFLPGGALFEAADEDGVATAGVEILGWERMRVAGEAVIDDAAGGTFLLREAWVVGDDVAFDDVAFDDDPPDDVDVPLADTPFDDAAADVDAVGDTPLVDARFTMGGSVVSEGEPG